MDRTLDVWVIDDDRSIRWVVERALTPVGMRVRDFAGADEALAALEKSRPDVVLTDLRMPGTGGIAFMERARELIPDLPIIVMTAHADLDSAVSSFHGGAFEYLPKPFDVDQLPGLVRRAAARAVSAPVPPGAAATDTTVPGLIGTSTAMQGVFRAIGRLARASLTVLITGESGTGKELVARALHRHSPRAAGPFIALNMAAVPRELLESELFGHERGSFTGANARRAGRFEQAPGGTLFLDEIGDMPADLQTRLLRVLAEGEYYAVGGDTPQRVDVRIIAATHQDLERAVREGRFREDLFHRLNVIRIHIPALRERRGDIDALARHFLAEAAAEIGVPPKRLSHAALAVLEHHPLPGNVRQLENLCRWLTVMASGDEIGVEDLPGELRAAEREGGVAAGESWEDGLAAWALAELRAGRTGVLNEATARIEKRLMEAALGVTGGRRIEAARLLGLGRNTLTRKLKDK